MKKILLAIGLFVSIYASGQKVFTDSIDYSLIVAGDTCIYIDLGRGQAGKMLSVEFDYTSLDNTGSYLGVGYSNTGYTCNVVDSVQLDTANGNIVNGVAAGAKDQNGNAVTTVATKQATYHFIADAIEGKWMVFRFDKGNVTSGKVYWYIMKM